MFRIIGNLIFILLFIFNINLFCNTKISIKAKDHNSYHLQNAGIGQSFIIELVVEDNKDSNAAPKIENLENYLKNNFGVSKTISNINGNIKIVKVYKYEVRIDTQGHYKFGPVYFDGKQYNSFLNILVDKNQKSAFTDNNSVSLNISMDKNKVFKDEQVELTIKFLYKNNNINLVNYEFPSIKDFYIDNQKRYFSGEQRENNQDYLVHETKFFIYPNKIGKLLIPAFKAHYEVPSNRNFFGFFATSMETRKIISNSIDIQVEDIPDHSGKINGVGVFKNFNIQLNQKSSNQNEGIILRLEIEGKANMQELKIEKLGLDESIKCYESKNYVEESNSGFNKKIIEYIIQCTKPGTFKIPSQIFNYFDPILKKFNSLKSSEIEFKIYPAKIQETNKPTIDDSSIKDDIKSIRKHFEQEKDVNLSNKLFFMLISIPLLLNIFVFRKYLKFNRSAVNKALFKLKIARKKKDVSNVHHIFMNYFLEKYDTSDKSLLITKDVIKNKLSNNGIGKDIIEKWEVFFNNLHETTFFNLANISQSNPHYLQDQNSIHIDDFFDEAFYWLNLFKKKL